MPVVIDNRIYYRTVEVCRTIGICRNTLFNWLKDGVLDDVEYRDWRGWRLFTTAQLETIKTRADHVIAVNRRSRRNTQTERTP